MRKHSVFAMVRWGVSGVAAIAAMLLAFAPCTFASASAANQSFPWDVTILAACLGLALAIAGKFKGKIVERPELAIVIFLICMSPVGYIVNVDDFHLPGNQQGYAPEQPVPFSHTLHAGTLGIPCQYCHSAVMEGRHATLPGVNTCMNCHDALVKGTSPISSPTAKANIEKVFQYHLEERPIPWVRIHRLPDFVRFNHSAHTTRGIDCEHCHGPVKTMDVMRQDVDQSMGFCLNCHRDLNAKTGKDDIQGNETRAPTDSCGACHN